MFDEQYRGLQGAACIIFAGYGTVVWHKATTSLQLETARPGARAGSDDPGTFRIEIMLK